MEELLAWNCPLHHRSRCIECKFGLCKHDKRGDRCRECNTHFCEHDRRKERCKDCGTGVCEHQRIKERCRECKKSKQDDSAPAALTDANLEAHDFRLDYAAAVVKSFANKRKLNE